MNGRQNSTSLLVGVVLAVIGWLASAVGVYVSLNSRIATLEAHSERIPVIEAKLDRLIERPR